jgi:hypothetical protein
LYHASFIELQSRWVSWCKGPLTLDIGRRNNRTSIKTRNIANLFIVALCKPQDVVVSLDEMNQWCIPLTNPSLAILG